MASPSALPTKWKVRVTSEWFRTMVPQHIAVWAAVDHILGLSSALYDLVDSCLKQGGFDDPEFCTGCKSNFATTTWSIGKVDLRARSLVDALLEAVYQRRLDALMKGWRILPRVGANEPEGFHSVYCPKLAAEPPHLERAKCNAAHLALHSLLGDLKRAYVGLKVVTLYAGEVDGEHLPVSSRVFSDTSNPYANTDQEDQAILDIHSLTASLQMLTLDSRDLSRMTGEQRRSFLSNLRDVHDVWSNLQFTKTLATGLS
jgi:hypothetical protein